MASLSDSKDTPKPTVDTDSAAIHSSVDVDPTTAADDTPTRPGQVERFTTAPSDVPTLAGVGSDATAESSETANPQATSSALPIASSATPENSADPASTKQKPAPLGRTTTTAIGPAVDTPTTPSVPLANSHFASLPQTSDDRTSPSGNTDLTELTGASSSLPSITEPGTGTADPNPTTTDAQGSPSSSGPAVLITLLLQSGARHPFKLDGKYLARRNVGADNTSGTDGANDEKDLKDPWTISVYTVKELILRDWRDEWDPKPMSPSSIRLIHFGKMLDDKTILKDLNFQPTTANVVHMTVKPAETFDEDDAGKSGKTGRRRGNMNSVSEGDADGVGGGGGCCRCCAVM